MNDVLDQLNAKLAALAGRQVLPAASAVRQRGVALRRRRRRRQFAGTAAALCLVFIVSLLIVDRRVQPENRIDTAASDTSIATTVASTPTAIPIVALPDGAIFASGG